MSEKKHPEPISNPGGLHTPVAGPPGRSRLKPGEAAVGLLEGLKPETQVQPILNVGGLRGRSAIVTGGATGIGKAVVLELARSGVNVAFNYLEEEGSELVDSAESVHREVLSHKVRAYSRSCDVRDPDQVNRFVLDARGALGGLHILVNNAGISRDRAMWRLSREDWAAVVQTNLTGAFYFTRAVARYFRAQEYGKVVNVASVHGLRPEFGISAYAASKAGLIGLTRSAAVELGPRNINVNAVAPGYIRTTRLTESVPAEILDRARERSVLGRLGDPQDVANVVLFLCSEAARHITGAVISIDGGYLL